MHFLHHNPDKAARALCEQDIDVYLAVAIDALQGAHKIKIDGAIRSWVLKDGFNYHWLAYFAERLSKRHSDSTKWWSEIMSLRRNVPTHLRCVERTQFPILQHDPLTNIVANTRIAAYRTNYVLTRHKYAEWTTAPAPGWFFRLANTILPERDKQNFLLRVQPSRLDGPVHKGIGESERAPVRDGPSGEITGDAGSTFSIW